MSLRQLNLLNKPMPPVPMQPRMLRPCVLLPSKEQRSPTPKPPKKPRSPKPVPSRRPKPLASLQLSGMLRHGGPPRPNYSRGNMAKSCETWRSKSSDRKAAAKVTSSLLARPPYMPAQWSSKVCWCPPTRFCWGMTPVPHSFSLLPKITLTGGTACPSSSSCTHAHTVSQAQKVACFPRSCGQQASKQNHTPDSPRRTPKVQKARGPALE